MSEKVKILFVLIALAILLFIAFDFHGFLEERLAILQEGQDCRATQLVQELDKKCEDAWPLDSEACKRKARLLVRRDL